MLNMYCLRSTPTAPPLVVLTDWQPLSSKPALSAHKTNDLFMNTLPENMARILGGELYRRQIQQTCCTYISDSPLRHGRKPPEGPADLFAGKRTSPGPSHRNCAIPVGAWLAREGVSKSTSELIGSTQPGVKHSGALSFGSFTRLAS